MRFRTTMAAAALALFAAAPASAQSPIFTNLAVQVTDHPFNVAGGGGFEVNIGSPLNFEEFIVWCIDETRTIGLGNYTYDLYSFAGFAGTSFGGGAYDVDAAGMNRIASLVSQLDAQRPTVPNNGANQAIQNDIWDNFEGTGSVGDASFDADNWYVLWNGQNQTFAFQVDRRIVPEPASFALVMMGGAGLIAVARRRRTS